MWRRSLALIAAGLLATGASACAAEAGGDSDGASGDTVHVVAAFYPLEFIAERVGTEHVSVTGLTPPGVEAHDLELTPSQVADVSQADLVLFLNDFQPAVDDAVAEYAGDRAFDVAAMVPLLAADGEHGHRHEGGAEDAGDEQGPGHGEGGEPDPHLWLDPGRLATIAEALAGQLSARDPDNAASYAANLEALHGELAGLDAEYAAGLADCQRREIVVSHAAFGYLADRYDLHQVAITGLSPEDEPSPQRLAEVIHEAEGHDATTIFFEVLVNPAVAEVIATEVGAETAVLDPVEGLAADSDQDYLSLMRANLDALRSALECT